MLIFVGLTIAAQKNFPELLDELVLIAGINVNLATQAIYEWHGSHTPLMTACWNENHEIVEKLLKQKNIDISYKDKYGDSALHISAEKCSISIKHLAKVPGLDWNDTNNRGHTPLYLGLLFGKDDVVKTIISVPNIDYRVKTNEGETLSLIHI